MKKQLLAVMGIVMFSTTYAQANQKNRVNQMAGVFLKLANDGSSDIAKKLAVVRDEESTGFCHDACVIPLRLTNANIRTVVTENSLYQGSFEGDENGGSVEGGYEEWSIDVHVPARNVSYGGRIESMKTVVFECSLEAKYGALKAQIRCMNK